MGTKDTVLSLLAKNRGFFISGERIAEELGISRTAIWKAVRKLRREGYEIEAVTNRGYRLNKDADIMSADAVIHYLSKNCEGLRPEVFDVIDSTNDICMSKAASGEPEGYVAIAGRQTKGRGRKGRSFFSPSGTGLYISLLLRPSAYPGREVLKLTPMAAAAVCEAIELVSERKTGIKWVNDILIEGRKVCGILCEANYPSGSPCPDYVVVGIGVNVYPPEGGFPPELANTAGSVFDKPGFVSRNRLAADILSRFISYYRGSAATSFTDEYRKRSVVTGKDIMIYGHGDPLEARAVGIDDDCGLVVRYPDGREEVLDSGEISIKAL